jgi:exo-beta-1,3-glucanase (GH17 family)
MKYALLFVLGICLFSFTPGFCQNVQIIDDWYYIDGEKFFVKGIGYETHTRPGQVPWVYAFDANLIQFDLDRIKAAGFNTIRTWGALSEAELKLVEASGLKILFGIWIDPAGDFGNKSFANEAYRQVTNVLNYSARYKSIIGYLIMNEPQVQAIYDAGAQGLADLWQSIIDLIHTKHPGIPVSFSNTIIGDYINMEIFDFAGYNAYIYNPVTITHSHGYAGFLRFLKQQRAAKMPLIITEYGLSVSPGTPGKDYGYGGNSLEQQQTGALFMLRSLIDAGAQGNCVFQYHDGWWKGGNEYAHDSGPEEWFGLIGFSGLGDKYGTPRPVWAAYQKYNQAIITHPKNEAIYLNQIPVEFFTTPAVAAFSIREQNGHVLLAGPVTGTYYSNDLAPALTNEMQDFVLVFDFFNAAGDTLKSETISILCAKEEVKLPELAIDLVTGKIVPGSQTYFNLKVTTNPQFTIENNKIDYVVHPHIGFDAGITKWKIMSFTNNKWTYLDNFSIPAGTQVATFGAGFTIRFGQFKKRITQQKIVLNGDWANPIAATELRSGVPQSGLAPTGEFKLFPNYPNPFNGATVIQFEIPVAANVTLKIYDLLGREVATLVDQSLHSGRHRATWDGTNDPGQRVASGLYFYRLDAGEIMHAQKMILAQ